MTAATSGPAPEEQQVRDGDEAAERVAAYLNDHKARYPYDATGVLADLPAAAGQDTAKEDGK